MLALFSFYILLFKCNVILNFLEILTSQISSTSPSLFACHNSCFFWKCLITLFADQGHLPLPSHNILQHVCWGRSKDEYYRVILVTASSVLGLLASHLRWWNPTAVPKIVVVCRKEAFTGKYLAQNT